MLPQVLFPGVARVFDQFGILKSIQESVRPIQKETLRWPDGSVLARLRRSKALSEAFDLPPIFFERQECVAVLYNSLQDKSKVRIDARVVRLQHTETSVKVFLADGTYEEGDIVVGADGVHSLTRQLMWNYAAKEEPGAVPESDKTAIFSQYKGVFGVTNQGDLPDIGDADTNVVLGDGSTKLLFTQPGIAYWGITWKDEYSCPPKPYKPSLDEQEQVGERFKDVKMAENLTFGDLWKNKSRSAVLNIEEGILDTWHAGRIVLVGDSAHKVSTAPSSTPIANTSIKMTADLGIGANIAIESAVTLCNLLQKSIHSPTHHPTAAELAALFSAYQAKRHKRAKAFVDLCGRVTRMRSYAGFWSYFFLTRIATLPWMVAYQTDRFVDAWSEAPKLEYVGTRTINEDAEGWTRNNKVKSGNALMVYMVVTAVVGVGMWYAARLRYG